MTIADQISDAMHEQATAFFVDYSAKARTFQDAYALFDDLVNKRLVRGEPVLNLCLASGQKAVSEAHILLDYLQELQPPTLLPSPIQQTVRKGIQDSIAAYGLLLRHVDLSLHVFRAVQQRQAAPPNVFIDPQPVQGMQTEAERCLREAIPLMAGSWQGIKQAMTYPMQITQNQIDRFHAAATGRDLPA